MTIRRALAVLLAAGLAVLAPAPADAGYRELHVLFVNMTPDAESSGPSKECVRAIKRELEGDDFKMWSIGETRLRGQAGKTAGEPFLSWTAADYEKIPAPSAEDGLDTIVLVDCRPERRQLDVAIRPPSGGVVRLKLRHRAVDARAIDWVGAAILRRAWSGFIP
jgi:hypothetical protein